MSKHSIKIVTIALLLSNLMAGMDGTIVNTALPAIISDLHGIELMGWVVAIFLLGTAVTTPLWSKLGEHVGNKTAYQIATSLFVISSFFEGMAPNIYFLIVARLFMGMGNGGMVSIPYIIYARMYKNPLRRAKVMGFVTASFSSATIIGPLIGGWIVDTWSWHWIFYINIPLGLLSIILVQIFFKTDKKLLSHQKVDYLGALFLTTGLMTLLTAIQMIGKMSTFFVFSLFIVSIILLTALIITEQRAEDPMVPSRLFKNPDLVIDFLLFILIWAAFIAFNIYAPMWAQGLLATSALLGGATQIPGAFTNFGGSEAVVPLQRHLKTSQIVAVGILAQIIAYMMMVFAKVSAPYSLLLVVGMFMSFGTGMCFSTLQVAVQENAEPQDIPTATSFSYLIRILSQAFMSSILGLILNQALFKGVRASHGKITMNMMNKLSDSKTAQSLPTKLIPEMRMILYHGLHNIMVVSLVILLISFVICFYAIHGRKNLNQTTR